MVPFLSATEVKYSTNELELLAVAWSLEYFRNYIFGERIDIVSDDKVLLAVLRRNRGKNLLYPPYPIVIS